MTFSNKKIIVIVVVLILIQLITFWDYIGPIQWGQLKVRFNESTGHNCEVVNGEFYLKHITPSHLRDAEGIRYSEIFNSWETFPNDTDADFYKEYIIKGSVTGIKKEDSTSSESYPVMKVNSWKPINPFFVTALQILLIMEFALLIRLYKRRKKLSR